MPDTGLSDALARLDQRLAVLLPPQYRERYQDLAPIAMRAAPFVYDDDGGVAWNRMWQGFCDLAMAGGPPHKGRWLAPGLPAEVAAAPEAYVDVVAELRRGIGLATGLDARPADRPGWVPVACYSEAMADWMTRAIVMENVAARHAHIHVQLPAAPGFRIEKEIRNVVTVAAKTSHYWVDHMPYSQQAAIRALFHEMAGEGPVVAPVADVTRLVDGDALAVHAALAVQGGITTVPSMAAGWVGVACTSVASATWAMRALAAFNVLARREETTVFVPVQPVADPGGAFVAARVARVRALAQRAGRAEHQ